MIQISAGRSECVRCGACCIAPSISSPLPGMPRGKPAGVRCVNLRGDNSCLAYRERPVVCRDYSPTPGLCGASFEEAMERLGALERKTR